MQRAKAKSHATTTKTNPIMETQNLFNASFVRPLAAFSVVFIFIITGGALAMYLIAVPLIQSAHSFPSAVLLHQFHTLIGFGIRYMQTSARIQAALLATLTLLSYLSEGEEGRKQGFWFAASFVTLAQAAWYEIVFVFPTNDRLIDMKFQLERAKRDTDMDKKMKGETLRLLEKWRRRHVPRIILPFAAGLLLIEGILF